VQRGAIEGATRFVYGDSCRLRSSLSVTALTPPSIFRLYRSRKSGGTRQEGRSRGDFLRSCKAAQCNAFDQTAQLCLNGWTISVSVNPGSTTLTVMLRGARSRDAPRLKPTSPALTRCSRQGLGSRFELPRGATTMIRP